MRRVPHVVYWLNMPAPYFVDRLNAVADLGGLRLEVWFNVAREPDRSWAVDPSQWRFPYRWIPSRRLLGWEQHLPIAELRETRPDLFVMEWHRVNLAMALPPAKVSAGRTALRVLPSFDAVSERTWWRELGKRFLFGAVDAAKTPGPDGRALATRYGLGADRVFTVAQSIDASAFAEAAAIDGEERAAIRRAAGLEGCVFLYVGRLVRAKGIDTLLGAFNEVRRTLPDAKLVLVGDGEDERRYRAMAAEVGGVLLPGFADGVELLRWYAAADVMVFPTLGDSNGLAIDEALAASLPVIATTSAGDVRTRVVDGRSGYVVPAGDQRAMAERMRRLGADPVLRARLRAAAPDHVPAPAHEIYAHAFRRFVEDAVKSPRRTGSVVALARGAGHAMHAVARRDAPAPLIVNRRGRRDPAADARPEPIGVT